MNQSRMRNQQARLVTAIPGPKSRALRAREEEHIAPGLQSYAVTSGIVISEARGSTVTDIDGNVFLDLIGGIGVNSFGHSHPKIVEAVQQQVAKASVGSFTSQPRIELVERLAKHAPAQGVHRVQLYSTGSEAVESSLRLAKSHTGKYEFVSFWGGFHGKTLGSLSLMGSTFKNHLGPYAPGAHVVPYADCYRCPVGQTYPTCGVACAEMARKQVKAQSSGSVAAVIVEPMQGTAGNVIPPDEFLRAVRSLADELDALLIVDEMITGFGRTGRYWGLDHAGVRPDIVTLGKAFGGGYPLSGVLTTDEISRAKPWALPSGSSSSYGGNPLAAAAGEAALRTLDEEKLVENARSLGILLLKELTPFLGDYPFVGDVRGRGLLAGIELVKSKRTKEPLKSDVTRRIYDACVARGLLAMTYTSRVRLQPALTIDEDTLRNAVLILREVFDLAKRERWCEAS